MRVFNKKFTYTSIVIYSFFFVIFVINDKRVYSEFELRNTFIHSFILLGFIFSLFINARSFNFNKLLVLSILYLISVIPIIYLIANFDPFENYIYVSFATCLSSNFLMYFFFRNITSPINKIYFLISPIHIIFFCGAAILQLYFSFLIRLLNINIHYDNLLYFNYFMVWQLIHSYIITRAIYKKGNSEQLK